MNGITFEWDEEKEKGVPIMATKTMILEPNQKPSKEQLMEVAKASKKPILIDDDSPEFTEAQLAQFKRLLAYSESYKRENRKQNVTLRLSPQTIKKAKALGKGYTSILAAIIENALNNPEDIILPMK